MMSIKKIIIQNIKRTFICFTALFLFCGTSWAAYITAEEFIRRYNITPERVYKWARERNAGVMQRLKSTIDIKDSQGNTALCLAQQDKDKNTYLYLLRYGASQDVECHDDDDAICAVIVGNKTHITAAGWLLGAAAAGGAIWGISELLDSGGGSSGGAHCPEGYFTEYATIEDCGKTGADGWLWEQDGEIYGKACGKCTEKNCSADYSIVYQNVEDCGSKSSFGWEYNTNGWFGDLHCGRCTPKVCPLSSSTAYTQIELCPTKQYMHASGIESKGWSGEKECFACQYECDETTGFSSQTTCETNEQGEKGYDCLLDSTSQCYYRQTTTQECPAGSSTFYKVKEHCPTKQYARVSGIESKGWSGENECFACLYECDETTGFSSQTTCQTNEQGEKGYDCTQDADTQCYYRNTPTCSDGYEAKYQDVTDCVKYLGGGVSGWNYTSGGYAGESKCGKCEPVACTEGSTEYTDDAKCPTIKYKRLVSREAKAWSGSDACYKCVYVCDSSQGAVDDEETCKSLSDIGCQYDATSQCYIISDGCTEGSTRYQSVTDCGSSGSLGWNYSYSGTSNGKKCGICTPKTCSPNITSATDCGSSGSAGWDVNDSTTKYAGNTPCKECKAKSCPASYAISSGDCEEKDGVPASDVRFSTGYYSGNNECGVCIYECPTKENDYFSSQADCEAKTAVAASTKCEKVNLGNDIECWHLKEYPCDEGDGYSLKPSTDITNCEDYENIRAAYNYSTSTIQQVISVSQKNADISYSDNLICVKCNYKCVEKDDTYYKITSANSCGEHEDGWTKTTIFSGCYKCTKNTCSDANPNGGSWTAEDCYEQKANGVGNPNAWMVVETQEYAGDNACEVCAAKPCKDQGLTNMYQGNCASFPGYAAGQIAVNIFTGTNRCQLCTCQLKVQFASNPNYCDTLTDGTYVKQTNTSLGETCYYCEKISAAALNEMQVVNNQTLIDYNTEGDYLGAATVNALGSAEDTPEAVGSITLYNSAANATIALQHNTEQDIYNAYAEGSDTAETKISASGTLNLINEDGADNNLVYGQYSKNNAYNAVALNGAEASGIINIEDTFATQNTVYGIQADGNAYNSLADNSSRAAGKINLITATNQSAYGINAGRNIYNEAADSVVVKGTGSGNLYGLYSQDGSVYNRGTVDVSAASGNAYGVYLENGAGNTVENSGTINVKSAEKTAYGIYVQDGGTDKKVTITNTGTINAAGDTLSRGIFVEKNGQGVTINNAGTIIVNGSENGSSAIDLNGGTLATSGITVFAGSQNLNLLNGRVVLEDGGIYEAQSLSGDLLVGQSVVTGGYEDTYVQTEAIKAEETDNLNINSESAMFNTRLQQNSQNSYDVVAERRAFAEFSPTSSIAEYLEQNYKEQRLGELYERLKAAGDDYTLRKEVASTTGADILTNFPQENLNALRNIGEVLADSLLTPTEEIYRVISGADSYYQDSDGKGLVDGYENTTSSVYMYGDKRINNWNRLGIGLAIMQMSSSYDNGSDRDETFISLFMPWLHQFSDKLRLSSILSLGYGFGDYDRGQGREADISDYIYGLTNKLVYSVDLAGYAELEPALMLNVIGYYQDDMKEDGETGLLIQGGNHLSVEAGLGLYLKKQLVESKYGKLSGKIGAAYYHELADPYHKIRAGFRNGIGSFEISDFENIYNRDRAVLSAMLDYEYKKIALYAKYHQLLQKNKSKNFDLGLKYNF